MNIAKNISLLTVSLLTALYGSCIYSTDLTDAAKNGNLELVNALILSGVNINQKDADGMTALHWAARCNHVNIVHALIATDQTAVQQLNVKKHSPLHEAACKGSIDIVRALINAKADVNQQDICGNIPLILAIIFEHVDIVSELINAGANVNIENCANFTPLHFAAMYNCIFIAPILIAAGANLNKTNGDGHTPLQLARKQAMVKLLSDYQKLIHDARQIAYKNAKIIALSTHERLGAESPLATLPDDGGQHTLLRCISKLIVEAEVSTTRANQIVESTIK